MLVTNISAVTRIERTRAALLEAALDLFGEHGFDETTVAQIAARAGVTEMTFYRHFGTKDAVLVDDPYDPLIAEAVVAADPGLSSLEAAAAGVLAAWRAVPEPEVETVRDRLRLVAATPSQRAAMTRASTVTEDAVAGALQIRGVPALEARIASGATIGALNSALIAWSEGPEAPLGVAIEAAASVLTGER
jgi:AcrR family transcriptional regulator